jgi:hypothetical protein
MPDPAQKPAAAGPILASFFSKMHALTKTDAVLTALLCGGAVGLVITKVWDGSTKAHVWGVVLGLVVAFAVYIAVAPESMVTACLVSARKQFLDGLITRSECVQLRKHCLRKSLLY